jgi:hypothetical protein
MVVFVITLRPIIGGCQIIGAKYVQRVVNCLNDIYLDIHTVNACQLFNHTYYPRHAKKRTYTIEEWLTMFFFN